jgi:RimJ/RimL family protein N-acetyltransferase
MISGKYVGLRAIEKDDLQQMLHWRNLPQFRQYFREYRELNFMNQEYWFENIVQKDRNTIMFSIVDLKNGNLLGSCGLCYINWINRNADFSLYIGASDAYIDKKFAPDAGKVLLKYGFNELNLHRVYAEVFDFDTQKQALMKRLGFRLEGEHRETHWSEGRWNNLLMYGVLKNDDPLKRN